MPAKSGEETLLAREILQYADLRDCFKVHSSETLGPGKLRISFDATQNVTTFAFANFAGTTFDDCIISIHGQRGGAQHGAPVDVTLLPPSASRAALGKTEAVEGGDETATGFAYGYLDESGEFVERFVTRDLTPFTIQHIVDAMAAPILSDMYEGLVSLLDGDTRVVGSRHDDRIEVGAGDDRVFAKAGDDTLFAWRPGDLLYNGGPGNDLIEFASDGAGEEPIPVAKLVIDLAKGTGVNPFGGDLTLKSVETIRDTAEGDRILGSKADERVLSDRPGGDVFKLRGGDDFVSLFGAAPDMKLFGGPGRDQLDLALPEGDLTIDLARKGGSEGVLENSTVRGFEIVKATSTAPGALVRVIGSDRAEEVLFTGFDFARTAHPSASMSLGKGDDAGQGSFGDDRILGGAGRDALAGGEGADTLVGGAGRDALNGGPGDDLLRGGGGPDLFEFLAGFDIDRVEGFDPNADRLDFRGHDGVGGMRDLALRQRGDDLRISDGEGGVAILSDTDRGDVDGDNFLF